MAQQNGELGRFVRLGLTLHVLGATLIGAALWPSLAKGAHASVCYQRGQVRYVITNQTATSDGRGRNITVTETGAILSMLGYDSKPVRLSVTWSRPPDLLCDTAPVELAMSVDGAGSFVGRMSTESGPASAVLTKYASADPGQTLNSVRLPSDLAQYLSDPSRSGYSPLPPSVLVAPDANGPGYAPRVAYKLNLADSSVGAEFRVRVELGGLDALGAVVFWPYVEAAVTPEPAIPAPSSSAAPDGAGLFQQMMPVLESPRCANCHGRIDVFAPDTLHKGGQQQPGDMPWMQCQTCHTRLGNGEGPAIWRQPESDDPARWAGLSAGAICRRLLSDPAGVIDHLTNDPRVALGFEGLRGIGSDSPYWPIAAAPPAMDRESFVELAQEWLDAAVNSKACPD